MTNQTEPNELRIGIGHDTHRLVPGGPLRLGGIDIEFDHSAEGHSDADVLLHAITDAILGAAALGDIGELFPDTSSDNKNRDSAQMLAIANDHCRIAGCHIINLDCIIFAQRPKLSSHKRAIAERVAQILAIASDRVGVKAKTGEGVGDVGQGTVIQAQCVALMQKS